MATILVGVTDHGTRRPKGAAIIKMLLEHGFRRGLWTRSRHEDRWPGRPTLEARQDTELSWDDGAFRI